MKNSSDPRHQKRVLIVQQLFSFTFEARPPQPHDEKTARIVEKLYQIDPYIEEAAPQFPLKNIAKIDVSILRLALFEILFEKKQPVKVIIDEAVELAKELGGESSPSFVNGVLGYVLKKGESICQ